jgi:hypothetical protein
MMTLKDLMTNECRSSPDGNYWEPCLPQYIWWRTRLRDALAVWQGKAIAVRQTTKADIEAAQGITEKGGAA